VRLNHLLIVADDLPAMRRFFVQVIGLEDGPRPPFPFPGHWLYSEGTALVHLAQASAEPGHPQGKSAGVIDHLAIEGADLGGTRERLTALGVEHFERRVPVEGHLQTFLTGPEGVRVELLFPLTACP
jgi:lactoylglutathione lyase